MTHADPRHPEVESFFHKDTGSWTHVVHDGEAAAIVDPVLDYNAASACTSTASADAVLAFVRNRALDVAWILETHAHADHLSAAGYVRDAVHAPLAIGRGIIAVQEHFKDLFGLGDEFTADGNQFDRLLDDDDTLAIGSLEVRAMATPGHTRDGLTYVVGDAAFIGDTLFAPDVGAARADFPGGDANELYGSIQRILALRGSTRLFLCHDYPPKGRESPMPETSIAAQAERNAWVAGVDEQTFIERRHARDATLPVPRLLLPALQVNIRGGRLPPPDGDGHRYLRLPLDRFGTQS